MKTLPKLSIKHLKKCTSCEMELDRLDYSICHFCRYMRKKDDFKLEVMDFEIAPEIAANLATAAAYREEEEERFGPITDLIKAGELIWLPIY